MQAQTSVKSVADELVGLLNDVVGAHQRPVPLHEPEFRGREWDYVKECLDSGWVSSVGSYVDKFESRLSDLTGAKHAVAVVNGTAALQVALRVCGVETGDEVLMPSLTFVATANAVSHCGAVPHFVDSDEDSLGISVQALEGRLIAVAERQGNEVRNRETGRRIAAIVPTHVLGHACEMSALTELADEWNLAIVEDAAEALGSSLQGRHLGTWGKVGVLSFNGNKIVTTGGGGALLTDDSILAHRMKHLTSTAKVPHRWEFVHDEIAYNYRLPNLNSALGCAQLEKLPNMRRRKRQLAAAYVEAAQSRGGFSMVVEPANSSSNYWLNAVRLDECDIQLRDVVLTAVLDAGYNCRPLWRSMHRLPMYERCPRADLTIAERLEASIICIPSSAQLTEHLNDDIQ